jgi:hypothetical protein
MNTAMDYTEQLTQTHRKDYDVVAERVQDLEAEIEKLKRRRLPGIKSAVQQAAKSRDRLNAHIQRHPELFESPRTVVIAGMRVGLQKGKGKVIIHDRAKTVAKIRQLWPDDADRLIKITETPVISELGKLPLQLIRRVGAEVEKTGDQVIIKPVDGDVDKLVNALMAEAQELEDAA